MKIEIHDKSSIEIENMNHSTLILLINDEILFDEYMNLPEMDGWYLISYENWHLLGGKEREGLIAHQSDLNENGD